MAEGNALAERDRICGEHSVDARKLCPFLKKWSRLLFKRFMPHPCEA